MFVATAFDLGPHWIFIVLSYTVTALTMLGLLAWVAVDRRRLTRTMTALENRTGRTSPPDRAPSGVGNP